MKKILVLSFVFLFALFCFGCGDDSDIEDDEDYITGEDVYFGSVSTDIKGDHVVLIEYAEQSECTPEALAEWYKQDVNDQGYAYALIEYLDKDDRGIHAANDVITKNVVIRNHNFIDETPDTIIYRYADGQLEKL